MKKIVFSFFVLGIILLSANMPAQTQKPKISFEKVVHDFGNIKEENGVASTTFNFTNTGSQPLIIGRVNASCGCTTPTWTKTPVPPGGKGFVKAAYNPRRRPGKFNKSITVSSNAENSRVVLRIKGNVEPKPKSLEDIYKYKMSDIRLTSNRIAFPSIINDTKRAQKLDIINMSETPVKIDFSRVPSHLDVRVSKNPLGPNQKGHISVVFDASKKNDWGYVNDQFFLEINDKTDGKNRIFVSATIREDFSKLTPEERANAPVADFDPQRYEFGSIQQGEIIEFEYKLTNKGKRDLLIRKIRASCGCTAIKPAKEKIAPGETIAIKTTFNSKGRRGRQNKSVTVITNDPKRPKTILWIKGEVKMN